MKGLYLVQWLSSEFNLRIHTALGMNIYLKECLQSWEWTNITGWNPKPNNRLPLDLIKPLWLSDLNLFIEELKTNFRTYNPVGKAEAELEGSAWLPSPMPILVRVSALHHLTGVWNWRGLDML